MSAQWLAVGGNSRHHGKRRGDLYIRILCSGGESDGLFSIPEPHRHRKLLSMREDPRYCRQSEVLDQTVYVHKLSRILEFQSAKVGTIGAEVIFKYVFKLWFRVNIFGPGNSQ